MSLVESILQFVPEVVKPSEKKLSFNEKLKWTLIILTSFFILSVVPLYGLGENALQQFEQLSVILGASFGSILSLGIGPIVTASIVLQLLNGSGILKLDTHSPEGRAHFQGLQKLLTLFFIFFESAIYVLLGGLAPAAALQGTSAYFTMQLVLIGQLILGGLLIMYMDEITTKWGFGSGVSLFIAAGVASEIMIRVFSPLNSVGGYAFGSGQPPVGALLIFLTSLVAGAPKEAFIAFAAIAATVVVFIISVYAQAMKIEIPLTFGRVRGMGYRWPLNFLYTSNMPVILIAALMANIQLWARLLQNYGYPILGTFTGNTPATGLVVWLNVPNIASNILAGSISSFDILHGLVYTLFLVVGSLLFSILWVQTSGMDAESQAKQIINSGLQIPGFRRDQRIIEHLLKRYIFPLTVLGGITIGLLAASADILGALSRGTGMLLTVMIIYRLYEDIARQHMMDMHPVLRKAMGGGA